MKKNMYMILLSLMIAQPVWAQNIKKMSDAEQLGMLAGWAMACGAEKKLEDFEIIASRLLANQSATDELEKHEVQVYTQAKWVALQQQKKGNLADCHEILEGFNNLPLFNATVYADGSVKLPDGAWSKPLRPIKKR